MSRCYEITISVMKHNTGRVEEIVDALLSLGYEAYCDTFGYVIQFYSETINITAGHNDESVAREIVETIWEANGAFCKVDVEMLDLDADYPSYSWDEASFDEWHKASKNEK